MPREAEGKVVVITGASAGVGRATARLFAENGAKLVLIARDTERLETAKNEAEEKGAEAIYVSADVSDYKQVESAADEAIRRFGHIDIWINDAMVTVLSEFHKIEPEDFRRVTDVTYHGYVYGTHSALKRMLPRNEGTIVQVGSALAYRGIPLQSAYCGAKHAIQGFTESIRSELLHDNKNIYITMVQMPALNTPQFVWCKTNLDKKPQPVPPIYQPEVAADAIYFAAFHRRREYYVGFNNTIILIGNKFFPGVGDWYLAKTGFKSQMSKQSISSDRKFNLYEPVPGDFAAHGDYDDKAKPTSTQFEIDKYQKIITYSLLIIILILLVIIIF